MAFKMPYLSGIDEKAVMKDLKSFGFYPVSVRIRYPAPYRKNKAEIIKVGV